MSAEDIKKIVDNTSADAPSTGLSDMVLSGYGALQRPTVELVRACDIRPEPIAWLWTGWLAAGKMHIFGGAPGTGKTTISVALAAIISKGCQWPDGSYCKPGNVVMWSGEDDPTDTLTPRLIHAGANLSRVYFITGILYDGSQHRAFDPAIDMEPLRIKLAEIGDVSLLIIDPIVSAIIGDSHKNAEVRRGLQPLVDLAGNMRFALLGITHFSKGTGGREPVERLTGSLAFGALARIVFVATKTDSDERLFIRAKSNIGPDSGGFEYKIQNSELEDYPGVFSSSIVWGNNVEGSALTLLTSAESNAGSSKESALSQAEDFLYELLLKESLPMKSVKEEAIGAGYSWATIRRAKQSLTVKSVKEPAVGDKKAQWIWQLPGQETEHDDLQEKSLKVLNNAEDVQQESMSTFDELEHLQPESIIVEAEAV